MMWVPVTLYTSSVKTRLYGTILRPILNRIQQRPFRYLLSERLYISGEMLTHLYIMGFPRVGATVIQKKKVKEKKEDGIY